MWATSTQIERAQLLKVMLVVTHELRRVQEIPRLSNVSDFCRLFRLFGILVSGYWDDNHLSLSSGSSSSSLTTCTSILDFLAFINAFSLSFSSPSSFQGLIIPATLGSFSLKMLVSILFQFLADNPKISSLPNECSRVFESMILCFEKQRGEIEEPLLFLKTIFIFKWFLGRISTLDKKQTQNAKKAAFLLFCPSSFPLSQLKKTGIQLEQGKRVDIQTLELSQDQISQFCDENRESEKEFEDEDGEEEGGLESLFFIDRGQPKK